MGMLDLVKGISSEPHNKLTIIMGKPGSGKTTLAGSYPKPILYIPVETDGGGEVLKNYSDTDVKTLPAIVSDTPGTANAKHVQTKMMELLDELIHTKHPYKTIIIDAYSSIEESVVNFLEKSKGKKLSLEERGAVGSVMLALRDKLVELSRTDAECIAICHIKDKECTDNITGEKTIMITPKMSYNNGNLLLERASNVMYSKRATVVDEDGKRRVAFVTYIGAHPNMDTKIRVAGKLEQGGLYIENCTYDNIADIMSNKKKIEEIKKVNVVEPQNNPFNEKKEGEDW